MVGLKRQSDPMPVICGYALDAYCQWENPAHGFNEFPHTVGGVETEAQAKRELRKRGWVFHRDGFATCPKCAAMGRV